MQGALSRFIPRSNEGRKSPPWGLPLPAWSCATMTADPPSPAPERESWLHRAADRLTVVCGFAELLRDGAYGPINDEQRRVLDTLIQEAKDAGALLLLISRQST